MNMDELDGFFDQLSDQYGEAIVRCFPRYPEMLRVLLEYLPSHIRPRQILDLGAGTGNLTHLCQIRYPDAKITAVDLSAESLDLCCQRSPVQERLTICCADMRSVEFAPERFDLIVSSIAIHHLTGMEKQALFARCWRWLRPGGMLAFADQCRGATPEIHQEHLARWRKLSRDAGATEEEWQMWMEHQRDHDHHDRLTDQWHWLAFAGFVDVDCIWRDLLWAVVQGRKQHASETPHPA